MWPLLRGGRGVLWTVSSCLRTRVGGCPTAGGLPARMEPGRCPGHNGTAASTRSAAVPPTLPWLRTVRGTDRCRWRCRACARGALRRRHTVVVSMCGAPASLTRSGQTRRLPEAEAFGRVCRPDRRLDRPGRPPVRSSRSRRRMARRSAYHPGAAIDRDDKGASSRSASSPPAVWPQTRASQSPSISRSDAECG